MTDNPQATEIGNIIARARAAQRQYAKYTQTQVDEVVTAVGWSLVEPDNNRELSEMAVRDTGLGNVDDKYTKNRRKTMGLLRDLKGAKSVGVIAEYPDKGLVEIARPVGVVGAIVPATNPAATPANKTINALKGGNAIILAPSPKGQGVCQRLIEMMHVEMDRIGAPCDLVQQLPSPVSRAGTRQLMQNVDLIVATGSQNNVREAYSSGTPAIGVGAGNVVAIVDETASVVEAATKIVISKTFDNATSCSSENNLVIVDENYTAMLEALTRSGAVMLNEADKQTLQNALWQQGQLNRALIAKNAAYMAQQLGLTTPGSQQARVLLVGESGAGAEYPFSGEKLSPVLTVYRVADFAAALARAGEIMDYQGKGHSISLHSRDEQRALHMGLTLPVCRVIVNQIHCYASGGSFDNGLPFSLSMGCGTWGRNSISDNMHYRHYLNTTRIAREIPVNEPSEADLFGNYWQAYCIAGGQRQ